MDEEQQPSAEQRLAALEKKFREQAGTLTSTFQALLARHDVLDLALKTVIAASPEPAHLTERIFRRLTLFQNEALFSADATEAYRVSFETIAEGFAPKRAARRDD